MIQDQDQKNKLILIFYQEDRDLSTTLVRNSELAEQRTDSGGDTHLVPWQDAVVVLHVLLEGGPAAGDGLADAAPEDWPDDNFAGGAGCTSPVSLADMDLKLDVSTTFKRSMLT